MIEDNAIEGVVHTIGHVVLVLQLVRVVHFDSALAEYVHDKCLEGLCEVTAGLGNDAGISEVRFKVGAKLVGNHFECQRARVQTWETTTNVEKVHVETIFFSFVEDLASDFCGFNVDCGITAATANMEGNTDNIKTKAGSNSEEVRVVIPRASEFDAELADGLRIVRGNAEDTLGFGPVLCKFDEFFFVVEGDILDANFTSFFHVGDLFARVCKNDVVKASKLVVEDFHEFCLRRAIESSVHGREHLEEDWIRVTLHGVEGLNHRQKTAPLHHLLDCGAEVHEVETVVLLPTRGSADVAVRQLLQIL